MTSISKRTWLLIGGILAAAVIVGAVIGSAQSVQSKSEQVSQLLREGDAKYAENDLAGALRLYMEAENLKPNSNQVSDKIKLVNDKINGKQGQQAAQKPSNSTTQPALQPVTNQDNNASGQDKPAEQPEAGKVPNLVGMTKEAAEQQLLAVGLKYEYQIKPSEQPANTVFQQDKEAGQPFNKGDRVIFLVSSGSK